MFTDHTQHPPFLRHRGRDHRRGPDAPFGFRGAFGPGRHGGRMIRRGEIRPLILAALATRPMHGYELIGELEAQSGGRWRPSAGSVYPTLQQLADEGLVTSEDVDGRRVYTLNDAGRAAASTGGPMPWADRDTRHGDFHRLFRQVAEAAMQVDRVGSARAREDAQRILTDARAGLYRVLADDGAAPSDDAGDVEA